MIDRIDWPNQNIRMFHGISFDSLGSDLLDCRDKCEHLISRYNLGESSDLKLANGADALSQIIECLTVINRRLAEKSRQVKLWDSERGVLHD